MFLQVKAINKQEERGFALTNISFTQQKFQKLAIAGETGSGKSTLLKIIAGLLQPGSGEVRFENKKVTGPDFQLIPGHKGIAYMSQYFELPNFLQVAQVLEYANLLAEEDAKNIYSICRIDHLMDRRTDQLSGGEKQRTALARLLIGSPKLLLLDEPFSNLDMIHKHLLKQVVHDIGEKLSITCTLISHDPLDTLSWADAVIVMKDGQIVQQASAENIYHHPVNEYVAALFGKYHALTLAQLDLFYGAGIDTVNGFDFIRPDKFRLVPAGSSAATGIVENIIFYGAYHEAEVLVAGDIITIRTTDTGVKKGDIVGLSL